MPHVVNEPVRAAILKMPLLANGGTVRVGDLHRHISAAKVKAVWGTVANECDRMVDDDILDAVERGNEGTGKPIIVRLRSAQAATPRARPEGAPGSEDQWHEVERTQHHFDDLFTRLWEFADDICDGRTAAKDRELASLQDALTAATAARQSAEARAEAAEARLAAWNAWQASMPVTNPEPVAWEKHVQIDDRA